MRYFIEFSYNGKAYHGWQKQPNAITVQQVLEQALSTLLRQTITVMGAGRTDTGVHAMHMVAHFNCTDVLNGDELILKLNAFLPNAIAVSKLYEVRADAHARFHALSRTYLYRIATEKNVFNTDFAYQTHKALNVSAMTTASQILLTYTDFQCFSKSNTDVNTYLCTITQAHWTTVNTELHFTITANRFLRNMVRAIVGTMVNIGLGKLKPDDLHRIITSKNRSEAGFSVPAKGLYLTQITYPEDLKL